MPKESLQSLLKFVEENPSGIAMFDRQVRYLAASRRWKSDYKIDHDPIGRSHYELFPELPEAWKAVHRRALAGETVRADHDVFRRQDGTTQQLQWVVWPWMGGDGEIGGILISAFAQYHQLADSDRESATPAPPAHSTSPEQREIIDELRTANLILNHLSPALFAHLIDHLTPVEVAAGQVLAEPERTVERVYFPLDGLNAMFRHLEDGTGAAVATGGRGGFVGLSVIADDGHEDSETRSIVGGTALAIRAKTLVEIVTRAPEIRDVLMAFNRMLMAQLSVSVSCMARHSLDQRLARWLLTAQQRVGDVALDVRQDVLAEILGVRRTGISEAMGRLSAAGIVLHDRSRIVIRDLTRLKARSCDCFEEAETARTRSAPDIAITPPIDAGRIRALVDRYRRAKPATPAAEQRGAPVE